MTWLSFLLLGFGIPGFVFGALISQQLFMGFEPGVLLIFSALGFGVGSVIGEGTGRTWQGAWLGLLMGPAGWLLVPILRTRPGSRDG